MFLKNTHICYNSNMKNSFVLALSTLIGTIVGAGIFGLPYVVSRAGIIPSIFYFVVLGGVILVLHLCFGEIALRTKEKHRLIGYAQIYLGGWARGLATLSTIGGVIGALLVYMILAGNFLSLLLGAAFADVESWVFSVAFWAILSLVIILGIQTISRLAVVMNVALFCAVTVILIFAVPHVQVSNILLISVENLFLPYGVVIFAFLGVSAIPEIADLFKNRQERRSLDNVIVWASVIVGLFYLVFATVIAGVSGLDTTPNALLGLKERIGDGIVLLGAFFGLVAISGPFVMLGNYLKNSLRYDYKIPRLAAIGFVTMVPLTLFLLGIREFLSVVGIVGTLMGAVDGVLIVLIYLKAKSKGDRKPEYTLRLPKLVFFLVGAILVAGMVAELAGKF